MGILLELILMGVGLSMDAFAVAICKGLGMEKVKKEQAFLIALFFGGFQAIMPFLGWFLGMQFAKYIDSIDHWIAFVLLTFIGGKMLWEAWKERNEKEEVCSCHSEDLKLKELFLLAIATSIDALAVGITFAFLKTPIIEAMIVIGTITFAISFAGVYIGNFFGSRYKNKAEFLGGAILIFLGVKILVQHLGIL